ncbi:MAG: choline dehydrogenase [Mangrovicoccus sp.]|nr:choline dehydrogenase [Mangrovicoccus sp.]
MSGSDVIVVGAGSAGCALAERLSRDESCNVTLLEAGPSDQHIFIRMPAGVAKAIGSKRFNWHFETTPQPHMNNRRLGTPRGKTLGGSSAINALIYIRGNAWDYDNWAAMGCPGWGYEDVLPYFRAVEGNQRGADAYHGGDGPLHVSDPESGNPAFEAFIKAGQELGHPLNSDFNGADQTGFGPFQLNISDGRRWSAADAFVHPSRGRANLTVTTGAQVLGLEFDGTRVTGVRIAGAQGVEVLRADHVVLAAGAIGTPQLLMLSGVGPADDLRAHGIDVVADRAGVGQNLHDHLEVKVKFRMTQPLSLWSHAKFPNYLWTGLQYITARKGVGRQQGLEAGAFYSLDPASPACDTQLHFVNALAFDGATADDRGHGFAIDTTQTRPESRGSLRLASADPRQAPLIDPNYLAEAKDREMMREGLKHLRELCAQPSLAPLCGQELRPGPGVTSDAQLDEVVRATADSIYHPVGTARMGRDAEAVVDSDSMAVNGVEGLYVADASVMPQIVSGNTNAPSIMIGSKGADLIHAQIA